MENSERKIFIPTGDTAHGDFRRVAMREVDELLKRITIEQVVKARNFTVELREGIGTRMGIMVNVKEEKVWEKDVTSKEVNDALNDFVEIALEDREAAEAKKEEILNRVPEEEREHLEGLMGFVCDLISEIESGNLPPLRKIE